MSEIAALTRELMLNGYYPELIADTITSALAGEELHNFIIQHETTFDREQLHRHLTVVGLTSTRLIVCHTDEHPADEQRPFPAATVSTEAVRLSAIASVVIQRVVGQPADFGQRESVLQEVHITVGWGAVSRIDVGPAACEDPQCEAEHGMTGTSVNDDLQIRVSRAADGEKHVVRAWDFAATLSKLTSHS